VDFILKTPRLDAASRHPKTISYAYSYFERGGRKFCLSPCFEEDYLLMPGLLTPSHRLAAEWRYTKKRVRLKNIGLLCRDVVKLLSELIELNNILKFV